MWQFEDEQTSQQGGLALKGFSPENPMVQPRFVFEDGELEPLRAETKPELTSRN
jgi:hypothetical protein